MQVKVLRPFRDKYTKALYRKGQKITVSKERFEEINSTALGVLVEEIKEAKAEKKADSK